MENTSSKIPNVSGRCNKQRTVNELIPCTRCSCTYLRAVVPRARSRRRPGGTSWESSWSLSSIGCGTSLGRRDRRRFVRCPWFPPCKTGSPDLPSPEKRRVINNFSQGTHRTYYLPSCQTWCAEQVPAWFYPNVLIVLRTNFTQLECTSHFTVQLVLFLGDCYVVFGCLLHRPRKVGVYRPAIGIQITAINWN